MEGEEEIHPAMQLLLARMDSHPEEFEDDIRWGHKYQMFKSHWNLTEKRLFNAKLRVIRMNAMHVKIMKELLTQQGAN